MENINIALIIAQLINIAILFYLFKKFVADRLSSSIEVKKKLIKKLDYAEKKYKVIIDNAYIERDKIVKEAKSWRNKLFQDMENVALNKSNEIISKAEKKADLIVEWWRREVEKERLTMLSQMKGKIIELSLKLNQKLFKNERSDKDFMNKELEKLLK